MGEYRTATGGVVRVADGAFVPADEGNRDWQIYLEWVAGGGRAEPRPANLSPADATFLGDPWAAFRGV